MAKVFMKPCLYCKKQFASYKNHNIFCCPEHKDLYYKERKRKKICRWCGNEFVSPEGRAKPLRICLVCKPITIKTKSKARQKNSSSKELAELIISRHRCQLCPTKANVLFHRKYLCKECFLSVRRARRLLKV